MSASEHSMQPFHRVKVVPSISLSKHRVFNILIEADYTEKLKISQGTPQCLKDAINMALLEFKKRKTIKKYNCKTNTKEIWKKITVRG